jgi:hypothetical protein
MLKHSSEGEPMTEAEWLTATDWRKMRPRIKSRKNVGRKVRLFSVACCRRIAHLFEDSRSDEALAVAEQFADGRATKTQLREAEEAVLATVHDAVAKFGPYTVAWARDAAWRTTRRDSVWEGAESCIRALAPNPGDESTAQAALFRDIFGNPYHRVRREKSWLTSDVLALAQGIYDDRAFDRMPILADALQDAGCICEDVLNHCRDASQPHVRGCWVIDLVLGKT